MSCRYIAAGAGAGKTQRLVDILVAELKAGRCRPETVLVASFTRQAAHELRQRCTRALREDGEADLARDLGAAAVGTLNGILGALVDRHALALDRAPPLRVLDDQEGRELFLQALGAADLPGLLGTDALARMPHLARAPDAGRRQQPFTLVEEVRRVVVLARSYRMGTAELDHAAGASWSSLRGLLPDPTSAAAVEQPLAEALGSAVGSLRGRAAETPSPPRALAEDIADCARHLDALARGALRWDDYGRLGEMERSDLAEVRAAARRHAAHPAFHADLQAATRALFQAADRVMRAYQQLKAALGVIDFVDQETLALQLLDDPGHARELGLTWDLVLLDEFQDVSPLQLEILQRLRALSRQSIWVGDAKQAIYAFRGSNSELPRRVRESLAAQAGSGFQQERLTTNWRSLAPLVREVSRLFVPAFGRHGISQADVRLHPPSGAHAGRLQVDADLGPTTEIWRLDLHGSRKTSEWALGVARGICGLLAPGAAQVRGGPGPEATGAAPRALAAGDVAVLCLSGGHCRLVAEALGRFGVAACLSAPGLAGTWEVQAVIAALSLAIDPTCRRHQAEVLRFSSASVPGQGELEALLDSGVDALADHPAVRRVAAASLAALAPAAAVDRAVGVYGLPNLLGLAASSRQGLANLARLRACAEAYGVQARGRGQVPTLPGFCAHLAALADVGEDLQGLAGQDTAVQVSTYHGAKGREWPVVVLADLEGGPSDARHAHRRLVQAGAVAPVQGFDPDRPLAGWRLRAWPLPYEGWPAGSPLCTAIAGSDAARAVGEEADQEALRLLYVGCTRARDRLIWALGKPAQAARRQGATGARGLLRHLGDGGAGPGAPQQDAPPPWPEQTLSCSPPPPPAEPVAEPAAAAVWPAVVDATAPPAAVARAPAQLQPSLCVGTAPVLAVDAVAPPWPPVAAGQARALGGALHALFPAALRLAPGAARSDLVARVESNWGLGSALSPGRLEAAVDGLAAWLRRTWPDAAWHFEVPFEHRLAGGTSVVGQIDLVVEWADGLALVDHKVVAQPTDRAIRHAADYAGQLQAYLHAAEAARCRPVVAAFVHLPAQGVAVRLAVSAADWHAMQRA